MLDNITYKLLIKAGWYEDRSIDTTQFVKSLEEEKYMVHATVVNFLKRYGNLRVFEPGQDIEKPPLNFHTVISYAISRYDPEVIKEVYNERIKKNLCMIGEARQNMMVLLMDEEGVVYAGIDNFMYFVGQNAEEAIKAVCLNDIGEEIKEV